MTFKDRTVCFGSLTEKLKKIDLTIEKLEAKINEMKLNLCEEEEMEICPDEVESEKALLEILKETCVQQMLDQEPEGDA